jgi:phage-related protein
MASQYDNNKAKHEALTRSLATETDKLKAIEQESGKTSKEYQDQAKIVSDLSSEVTKSSKNLNQIEQALSKMRVELTNATTEMTKTENELGKMDGALKDASENSEELGKDVRDAGSEAEKAATGGFTVFKGVLADLTSSAIKGALEGLKDLGSAAISLGKDAIASYADYEQLVGGVETLFGSGGQSLEEYAKSVGNSVDEAKGEYDKLQKAQTTVLGNASKAYKSAGLSANEYMENVTSFSASLTASLGGNTLEAAKVADRAIIDMADNANKMGTSMESITNAYQGFAKGNYTMLDNLKLGYGGTQEEMKRLIKDAANMKDIQKELGITVDENSMSFGNIVNALSVMQSSLGITGTTSKEAASTIAGSTAMMKSAWTNLITGVADDNANFEELINSFIESVLAVADNLLPRIQTTITGIAELVSELVTKLLPEIIELIPPIIESSLPMLLKAVNSVIDSILRVLPKVLPVIAKLIPQIVKTIVDLLPKILDAGIQIILALIQGIADTIPDLIKLLPPLIKEIITTLLNYLPDIIKTGFELLTGIINGILEAIPDLIEMLPEIITTIITTLLDNLPLIVDCGVNLLVGLINGIIKALPQLVKMAPDIIRKLVSTLKDNFPKIVENGKSIISSLVNGITSVFSTLKDKAGDIFNAVKDALVNLPSEMLSIGKNIVSGLWDGIGAMKDWVFNKVKSFGSSIVNGLKSALGIASPSKVFRDQVGKNIARGIGVGFTEEMQDVTKEMQDAIPTLDVDNPSFNLTDGTGGIGGGVYGFETMVAAFKEALEGVNVELDDQKVGKFVKKTVTKAIYT